VPLAADKQDHIVAVVDDDPRVRESLEQLFDSAGIAHISFHSAEEALQYGGLTSIRCLITDVRMPGIDGCELQRRMTAALPTLPIIFVTADHDDEVRRNTLYQGAVAFFYKPFDGEELLNTVDAAVRQSRTSEASDVDC
jgi:FixJ family two-component response regulator